MILSKDMGLVLFHLDSVWIEGKLSSNGRLAKEKLYPGSEVTFVVRSFKGDEYENQENYRYSDPNLNKLLQKLNTGCMRSG